MAQVSSPIVHMAQIDDLDAAGVDVGPSRDKNGLMSSPERRPCLVLSCLLTLYTAVMSFEILFPFGLWVSEPGWLLNHSQLV